MKKLTMLLAMLATMCSASAWAAPTPKAATPIYVTIHVVVRDAHGRGVLSCEGDQAVGKAFTNEHLENVTYRSAISMASRGTKGQMTIIPGVLHTGWRLMILPYFADKSGNGFANIVVDYTALERMNTFTAPHDSKEVIDLPVLDQQSAREAVMFSAKAEKIELSLWHGMTATIDLQSHSI